MLNEIDYHEISIENQINSGIMGLLKNRSYNYSYYYNIYHGKFKYNLIIFLKFSKILRSKWKKQRNITVLRLK